MVNNVIFVTIIWSLTLFGIFMFLPPFKKFFLRWFASDFEDEQAKNLLKVI